MNARPTISAIMPTRDRPRFAAQAVRYFQQQDHRDAELVIVDDGAEPVAGVLPVDDRVRVIRLDRVQSVGRKRTIACDAARGEFIANWDDDDWHAPRRLRVQLAALRESGREVCGLDRVLHYSPTGGGVWLRERIHPTRPALAGGSLLFRRSTWRRHGFPDVDLGEEVPFLDGVPAGRLLAMDDPGIYVALIHSGNAARLNLHDPQWRARTPDDIAELLVRDWSFYAAVRGGDGVVAPAARRPDAINFSGPFTVSDGYGSMAEYTALGMDLAGARLHLLPLSVVEAGLSTRLGELLLESAPDPAAPMVHHSPVDSGAHLLRRFPDYVLSTMWESDGLPTAWLRAMHGARALVAPTRWCADVFRAHGLVRPIDVVPDGVDPAVYHYRPPVERAGLTTLIVASNQPRKHLDAGVAAWRLAFDADRSARLLVKAHHQYGCLTTDDPRITYVDVNEPTRGIAGWYRRADVLMALGNEGSGLPLIEAMACGLPVVALDSEGQGDICAAVPDLVLPVPPSGWEPHVVASYGRCGKRAVPSVEVAAQRLRWVAGHRDEARDMGRAAAAWVAVNRDVWAKGPAILQAVERAFEPPLSLRPRSTVASAGP